MNTLHVGHFISSKNTDFERRQGSFFALSRQFEKEARGILGMAFLVHSFHFFFTMLTYSENTAELFLIWKVH